MFKSRHWTMDRVVALKIMMADRLGSPEAVERFRCEVQAAARLTNSNIIVAHDAGEAKGRPLSDDRIRGRPGLVAGGQ